VNRFSRRGWGEEKAGRNKTDRRGERGREGALTLTPFSLGHFTLSQSLSALPAAVRPFQPGPVDRLLSAQSLFLNNSLPGGRINGFIDLCSILQFLHL